MNHRQIQKQIKKIELKILKWEGLREREPAGAHAVVGAQLAHHDAVAIPEDDAGAGREGRGELGRERGERGGDHEGDDGQEGEREGRGEEAPGPARAQARSQISEEAPHVHRSHHVQHRRDNAQRVLITTASARFPRGAGAGSIGTVPRPRSWLQPAGALALVLGAAVSAPLACVLDWDPSHRSTPPTCMGFTCDCTSNGGADDCKCLGGGCAAVCAKGAASCALDCAGGGCTLDCNGVASCTLTCTGGGCHCTGGSGAGCLP